MRSYNLGNIEIMDRDLSYRDNKINYHQTLKGIEVFTYDMAIDLANQYGDNWRLPSIKEFKFLEEYYGLDLLDLSSSSYWANDSVDESTAPSYNHYAYYFGIKRYGGIPKDQRLKVRLVKDI